MVSRIVAAALALLTSAGFLQAELSLRPLPHSFELEGMSMTATAFRNGSGKVTWAAPHGWRISGEDRIVRVVPPNAAQAEGIIEIVGPPKGNLDPAFIKDLKERLATALPKEASALTWEPDEAEPMEINRHPTHRVIYTYQHYGQKFRRSVMVCNFKDYQILFHFVARERDYPAAFELFRTSLYSWQGVE